MKVRELIALLQQHDQDREVVIGYNYGDYGKTQVFEKAKNVEVLDATFDDYFSAYTEDKENPTDTFVSLRGA